MSMRRLTVLTYVLVAVFCQPAAAEVTKVTIASRSTAAGGHAFGTTGPYEKLVGTIDFALDPAAPHNGRIVDLNRAARGPDGRVHFTADLYVLQPSDPSRGNGVLLFDIANRGSKLVLGRFNRGAGGGADPTTLEDFGDGFLLREGYTLVWVGWQFDVPPPGLRVIAPAVDLGAAGDVLRMTFVLNDRRVEAAPAGLPDYPPVDPKDPQSTLSVRDLYWDRPTPISRERWSFGPSDSGQRLRLEGGFEPGRIYEIAYRARGARAAGVGLAAIRDAASAFRYRTDLPVRGRSAYVFGVSQSGRFLRQFLHDGFNADERGQRVFDAVWAHIAGAGQGSFNERFAMPGYSSFPATRFPFTDAAQQGPDGSRDGILATYQPQQQPKVFYTNTSVEYWGQGRAAALIHTTLEGTRDVEVPDNVRIYLLAGTQHGEAPLPPGRNGGQELSNPTPQRDVMRALLTALHGWVARNQPPPASRYPRLADGTLVPVRSFKFPAIPGVADPRTIIGPAIVAGSRPQPLPFLVPRVDADGNETAGIRVPEQEVPLATTTGWNFRAASVGNTADIYALLGSYIPFASTRAEREARKDPRPSLEERYPSRDIYLDRVRASAAALAKGRFLLEADVPGVVDRAAQHWNYATRADRTN
jgi:hypothetical protein